MTRKHRILTQTAFTTLAIMCMAAAGTSQAQAAPRAIAPAIETQASENFAGLLPADLHLNIQTLVVAGTAELVAPARDGYTVTAAPIPPKPPVAKPGVRLASSGTHQVAVAAPAPSGNGGGIIAYAQQFVGVVPYVLGGTSPATGFTCDTFVRYVFAALGRNLPGGGADHIARTGTVIARSAATAGDLVWYPGQHIGIYDGNGGIIDAPKPGMMVSHRAIWGNPSFVRL